VTAPDTLWTKTYGGIGEDGLGPCRCSIVKGHQIPVDGRYIVATFTNSFAAGDYDMWLLKTDAYGDTLWSKFYGGPYDELGYYMDLQLTADGGYILAGSTYSFGLGIPSDNNAYLIKTDSQGNVEWSNVYGDSDQDEAWAVQQTTDGGYIISAWTTTSVCAGGSDSYLIRTDSDGDTLWTKTIGGAWNDGAHKILQTKNGEYMLAGYTHLSKGDPDCYLVKLGQEKYVPVEVKDIIILL